MPLRVGQVVEIETRNHGRGPTSHASRKPSKAVIWTGRLIGRSVLGDDLWLVKVRSATYTVPRREIKNPSEKAKSP